MTPQSNFSYYRSCVYSRTYHGAKVGPHLECIVIEVGVFYFVKGVTLSGAEVVYTNIIQKTRLRNSWVVTEGWRTYLDA